MGIVINDSLFLNIGITQSGVYASFGEKPLVIKPTPDDDDTYNARSIAYLWTDKISRDSDKPRIQVMNISIGITTGNLDENIYNLLYTELKSNFSSTTDV